MFIRSRALRSARHVLSLLSIVALAIGACKKQQPAPEPAVAQSTPWVADPAAAAVIPASAGGATAAPLGAAPSAAPASAEPPPEPTTLRERAPLSDEQIAAVIATANSAELEQAKLARDKAKDAELKRFAAAVVAEHEQVAKAQKQLIEKLALKPAPSSVSDELSGDAASALGTLKKAKAPDFDGVYLNAQLQKDQKLLELLGTELVPNAKSVDLKAFLQSSQTRAQAHLDALQKMPAAQKAK
jgi:putative membrane protein